MVYQEKIPKYLYVVMIVLGVLIIGLVLMNVLKPKQKVVKNVDTVQTVDLKTSFLKVAKINLTWLDKQRDKRGIYLENQICSTKDPKKCETPLLSNRSGFSTMWALFWDYRLNKNEQSLQTLKSDLKKYADRKSVQIIQNNAYNCYIMYDLAQSDLLSEEDKANAKKICFDSEYELNLGQLQMVSNYESDVGMTYFDINAYDKTIKDNMKNFSSIKQGTVSNDAIRQKYSYFTNDYVARYLWTKDKKYLGGAYLTFNEVLGLASINKSSTTMSQYCALGVAAMSIYQIKNESVYLDFADNMLKKYANNKNANVDDLTMCALLSNNLYRQKNDANYLNKKNELLQQAIDKHFDSLGYTVKVAVDGGFLDRNGDTFVKDVKDNGLLTGLLIN